MKELEGAILPAGIEVDETSAYFGVFDSSEILHEMISLSRIDAFCQFFEHLSDIVLQPGDFDFGAASERLSCEGGEIYYLFTSHLGVMSLPDPLRLYLGMEDSNGEVGAANGALADKDKELLGELADPMRLIKLFAIASQTGGTTEVLKYLSTIEALFSSPKDNHDTLLVVARQMRDAFDVADHVMPIESLSSGDVKAVVVKPVDEVKVVTKEPKKVIPEPPATKK
jgi:hypothetical protein